MSRSFRRDYARISARLVRRYGVNRWSEIEDAIQQAFIAAVVTFRDASLDTEISGWLASCAERRLIEQLRRQRRQTTLVDDLVAAVPALDGDEVELLRMIAHPELSASDQVVLMLNLHCGLNGREIARALQLNDATASQRVVRAKQRFADLVGSDASGQNTRAVEPAKQHDALAKALYLLFTEGYCATTGPLYLREELCAEAIRLGLAVRAHPSGNDATFDALLALMYLQASRLPARVGNAGQILMLPDQDRSQWDLDLIQHGVRFFHLSLRGERLTAYHIEAAIAVEHAMAASFDETSWRRVRQHYDDLVRCFPTPIRELNRVVAVAMDSGTSAGWAALLELPESESGPYWATRAWLCLRPDAPSIARQSASLAVDRARSRAGNRAEQAFWQRFVSPEDGFGEIVQL
ncbi:MAG: DUF6596 domain-containing protein [Fimbriimonadaceae bacterium]|nr:DUF6596 domain-containing protein [Fimbriimonadaceae bacterium]